MKNDTLAVEAFSRAGKYLGIAIANFLHMLNPSIVILGGGVTQAGDLLLDTAKRITQRISYLPSISRKF